MDSTAQTGHNGRPNCPCDVAFSPSSMNSCLQSAGDWFNLYKTDLGNKIAAYNSSVTKASEKAKTCDADQGAFEMAFCEYEVLLSATCSTQSACITLQTSNRGTAKTNMQAKVASEKLMSKSCKKVRCYLDMLNATKVSQSGFDTCKSLVTDTSSLDITYPDAPAAVACDVSPVATKPGNDAWKVTEYDSLAPSQIWLSGFEGIKPVTACSEPAPASKWVKGLNGQDCGTVCSQIGMSCDSAASSALTTNEKVSAAFQAAGYSCKGFHGARAQGYAGAPFSTGRADDCAPVTDGGPKSRGCTHSYPIHATLCYCKKASP